MTIPHFTDEEAKDKWCPHVRLGTPTNRGSANRIGSDVAHGAKCLGSGCMMWRLSVLNPTKGSCGLSGDV